MKTSRRFLAICALFICLLAGKPAAWAENGSQIILRVMCYNIRHGLGMDNVIDLERTANAIRAWNPDLVAIQEVDRWTTRVNQADQAKILAEKLEMYSVFGKSIDHQGGDYGLLILSRFPILEHRMVFLPREDQREQRSLQIARIGIPDANGKIIHLANTHMSAGVAGQRAREAQIDMILSVLSEIREPVIFVGDINARPDNVVISRILETWTDAADPVSDKYVTPETHCRFGRIDYIFYRATDPLTLLESGMIADPITSDHQPVIAVFAF